MTLLHVKRNVRDDVVVVSAEGEIDADTIEILVLHLETGLELASSCATRVLVIELGDKVTYFGSTGLNAVLNCYERGLADGVAVRVVAHTKEVILPMKVTKLDGVLRPYETVSDAVAGANAQP